MKFSAPRPNACRTSVAFVALLSGLLLPPAAAWAAPTGAAELSGWLPPYSTAAEVSAELVEMSRRSGGLAALWTDDVGIGPDGSLAPRRPAPAVAGLFGQLGRQSSSGVGGYLDNSGAGGFEAARSRALLSQPARAAAALRRLAGKRGWSALNIDLEALGEDQAVAYERFLDSLILAFRGSPTRLSVSVQAQGLEPAENPAARFQRWRELARRDIDVVVMAYDHAWATSPPGAIAPASWVDQVLEHARAIFKPERLVVALPVYGYHWTRAAGANAWKGEPRLAPELRAAMARKRGWQRDNSLGPEDGMLFWKGSSEAIAFDDGGSVARKMRRLERQGFHRFALWRLGGESS